MDPTSKGIQGDQHNDEQAQNNEQARNSALDGLTEYGAFDKAAAEKEVANAKQNAQQQESSERNVSEVNDAEDNVEKHEAEKALDPRVESLAIPLARDYAEKNYDRLDDGTLKPAWRGANGESKYRDTTPEDLMAKGMPEAEARAAVIDIANTPYDQYSEHWKNENRGGAEFLVSLIDKEGKDAIMGLDLQDEATRAKYGDLIHNNWLERNSNWVYDPNNGDPKLAVPFAELSPEEQQKDIDQLEVTQKWLAEQARDDTADKNNYQNETEKNMDEEPAEVQHAKQVLMNWLSNKYEKYLEKRKKRSLEEKTQEDEQLKANRIKVEEPAPGTNIEQALIDLRERAQEYGRGTYRRFNSEIITSDMSVGDWKRRISGLNESEYDILTTLHLEQEYKRMREEGWPI